MDDFLLDFLRINNSSKVVPKKADLSPLVDIDGQICSNMVNLAKFLIVLGTFPCRFADKKFWINVVTQRSSLLLESI